MSAAGEDFRLRPGKKLWWVACPDCGASATERCRDQRNRTPEKRGMSSVHPRRSILENRLRTFYMGGSES